MKYVIFPEAGKLKIAEKPIPVVEDDGILVKVKACGLCGTDMLIYKGKFPVTFPYSPGHEYSGVVVDIGKKVKRIKAGDRVVIDPNCDCGYCYYCRRGFPHLCRNLKLPGVKSNGGFAEYCLVPEKIVYGLPDSISFEEATLVEPLSCCLHAVEQANIKNADTVAVIGGGTMGLISLMLCLNAGTGKVVLSEPVEHRRNLARMLGATEVCNPAKDDFVSMVKDINGYGADVVIENVGLPETIEDAFNAVGKKGRIVLSGMAAQDIKVPVSPFEIAKNEIEIKGTFLNPFTFSRAVAIIEARQIETKPLITHELPLNKITKAIEIYERAEAIKIVIRTEK